MYAAATVIWPYHVGFSHWANLILALQFHALMIVTVLSEDCFLKLKYRQIIKSWNIEESIQYYIRFIIEVFTELKW